MATANLYSESDLHGEKTRKSLAVRPGILDITRRLLRLLRAAECFRRRLETYVGIQCIKRGPYLSIVSEHGIQPVWHEYKILSILPNDGKEGQCATANVTFETGTEPNLRIRMAVEPDTCKGDILI